MIDQLSNIQISSAQLAKREASVTTDAQGGAQFVADPMAMMAELAEEIGFLAADKLQEDVDELEEDEKYQGFREVIAAKNLEFSEDNVAKHQEIAQKLLSLLRHQGALDREGFFSALGLASGGSANEMLSVLDAFLEIPEAQALVQHLGDLKQQFVADNEDRLLASMNVSVALAERDPRLATDDAERILFQYEDAVVASSSVLQVFQRLGTLEGQDKITDWRSFLTESVAADLKGHPSSTDKEKLQILLVELQGFRVFNTLAAGLDQLQDRYLVPAGKEIPSGDLMQKTLDYIEQPIREYPRVENIGLQLPADKSVLFLQDFRALLKSLPDFAYVNDQQKAQLLVPLQQKIDDLTYSEFDE